MPVSNPKPDPSLRKERICLGRLCKGQKSFFSDHPEHRLCQRCAAQVERIKNVALSPRSVGSAWGKTVGSAIIRDSPDDHLRSPIA